MASTEPRTPPLSFEITENIIQLYLGGPYTFPDSHRPSDLAPLLLVCKGWYLYGIRQLYESISITEGSEDSEEIEYVDVMLLCKTLSRNRHLAELVRCFTFKSKCFSNLIVFAITDFISLSSNLTHICISRLDGHWASVDLRVAEHLRHALTKRSLKHFSLYSIHNGDFMYQSDPLCFPKKTLALMANWPDLEEFSLMDESAYQHPFELPPETSARCLALRRVEVQGLSIACALAKIAPFVEDAYILHDKPRDVGTLACLHIWSETLTDLKLCVEENNEKAIQDFPPLRKLRYFRCEATDVHPRFLEPMESLEELYYCARPQRAEQLVNCFRLGTGSGGFLPALKVLRCYPCLSLHDHLREIQEGEDSESRINRVEFLRVVSKSLEEICARRSISLIIEWFGM
ncbi:hypothetical protein DFH11DRAFT_1827343 [Phellopilus nigrolimitatus]|nr:hypothetical protein DFH11DRAFT_1827343 [Phellopilus nigrolimitatus]